MKWVLCVIVIAGLAFESCRNAPDTGDSSLPEAKGPSQAADSLRGASSASIPGIPGTTGSTGSLTKTDTLPKVNNPMVDTLPKPSH